MPTLSSEFDMNLPLPSAVPSRSSARLGGALLLALLPLLAPTWAGAQVIRCTDPATGKVSYTDGKCASGNAVEQIEARRSPEEIQAERDEAAKALDRRRDRQKLEAEQRRVDEQQLQESDRRQQASQPPDPANSQACAQARRNLQDVQSTLGQGMYDEPMRLDAAQRQVEQACLTPEQWARVQSERPQVNSGGGYLPYPYPYVVRPPVVRPPIRPHPHPKPPVLTNCNVFRCTDAAGNVYPR